ncbi:tyrosine recombinase XerC [Pigmentiphaga aceris]|uniref:Tyrosine recombinase XerC n=1 Tax=Pigmentiphaga aceris TaxID=1940612 RepID=A0A5C0ARQ1_9BURK|nr:tyrosine recombinase XerC [Pigmentiphaga aceris]QEI04842.1 tyrosine recombinase XerC [Pigmentiphaga aceris]
MRSSPRTSNQNLDPDAPDVDLPPAVLTWLAELESVRRYSRHTLDAYRRDLCHLVSCAGKVPLESVAAAQVRRFLGQLHSQGLSPRSLARILAAWRGFYKWWGPQLGLSANPADGIRAPRAPRSLPKALGVEQTQAMLDHGAAKSQGGSPTERCDAAMFELLYSSGLRLSELTGLDLRYSRTAEYESTGWLDIDEAEVTVLGKGGKRRTVPVGAKAIEALRDWLAVRADVAAPNGAPEDASALFLGERGKRIAARRVQTRLARFGEEAGVATRVHPHVLRHSFASHVLQSAGDLRAVQEMLGHASISTTQIYTRLDFQHLAAAYDRAHPRAAPPPIDVDTVPAPAATAVDAPHAGAKTRRPRGR